MCSCGRTGWNRDAGCHLDTLPSRHGIDWSISVTLPYPRQIYTWSSVCSFFRSLLCSVVWLFCLFCPPGDVVVGRDVHKVSPVWGSTLLRFAGLAHSNHLGQPDRRLVSVPPFHVGSIQPQSGATLCFSIMLLPRGGRRRESEVLPSRDELVSPPAASIYEGQPRSRAAVWVWHSTCHLDEAGPEKT